MASIVVTTRNRRDELTIALESCFAQDYSPLEVLVFDDASADGTSELVRSRFPSARVFRTESHEGLIVLRNRGFRESRGECVFCLDDDAYYSDRGAVTRAMSVFAEDPRVGALALPFIEPRTPAPAPSAPPLAPGAEVRSYRGCAHAVRRSAALALGGYREYFVHQGEERDLAIRMMDRGYSVAAGAGLPIVHLVSTVRDRARMDYYGVRNTLLFDGLNIPHPYVVPRVLADAAQLFVYKLRVGSAVRRIRYVLAGFGACVSYARHRTPVSRSTYRHFRSLPVHTALPWSDPAPPPAHR